MVMIYSSDFGDRYIQRRDVATVEECLPLLYDELGWEADEAMSVYKGLDVVELTEHPVYEHTDDCYDENDYEICTRNEVCHVFEGPL